MFKNMKLGSKLYLGFTCMAVIVLLLGLVGYYGTVQSSIAIEEIGEEMSAQAETMKGMVDELVAIVGSSGKAQKANSRSGHPAQNSAKSHKEIASAINKLKPKGRSAKKSTKPIAEAVIPLDDDKQFSDF